ncbi:MAG: carboxymuconolactone decarboxylase family protein [Gemmatimonadaceae bacterium]
MSPAAGSGATLSRLDDSTRSLVRLSAVLAAGTEDEVRAELQRAAQTTSPEWIEELLLQTYLFVGFPRALNGMREWRRLTPSPASRQDGVTDPRRLEELGEQTCARVYGSMYDRLRHNIRDLHPQLDEWMILEGYGKVLSRPGLDLPRRELCIVAVCAATAQDRQLQSHLHGARNVGVAEPVVSEALASLSGLVPALQLARATRIWDRIRNDVH